MNILRVCTLSLVLSVQVFGDTLLLRRLFSSLDRVLQFALANDIDDSDFLFGLAIAKGQLTVAKKYLKRTSAEYITIGRAEHLADALLKQVPQDNFTNRVISSEHWTMDFPSQYLQPELTVANIDEISPWLDERRPTPKESDDCLGFATNCSATKYCMDIETTKSSAYALTHQVIYFQFIREMRCDPQVDYSVVIKKKCKRIYREYEQILEVNLPKDLQDLFLEQVVVCGLESIREFLNLSNLRLTLSLQRKSGCFGVKKLKRSHDFEECSLHLTGVATAVLGVFIKDIVKHNEDKLLHK